MLRGIDLQNAENLLLESAHHADIKPTDLQTEYIFASRRAAARRQRGTLGSVVFAMLVAIGLAIFGLVNSQRAEANLLLSQQTQSLFLSDLSRQEQESGHFRRALLLALESVQHFPVVSNGESIRALLNALNAPQQELLTLRHEAQSATGLATVSGVRWNHDDSQILSVFENRVLIWDSRSGDLVLTLQHDDQARGGLWSEDETRILTWSADATARIWDPLLENELVRFTHDLPVTGAFWVPGANRVVTWVDGSQSAQGAAGVDSTVYVWDASNGSAPLLTLSLDSSQAIGSVVWHNGMLAAIAGNVLNVWLLGDNDSGGLYAQQHLRMVHGDTIKGMAWNPLVDQIPELVR